jgi:hypothetical protein
MLRAIFFLFVLIAVVLGGWLYNQRTVQTNPIPLPYNFQESYAESLEEEVVAAEASDVLIIGDHYGLKLERFVPDIVKELSKNLKDELKVYNWSRDKEGSHRTYFKMRLLQKIPKIVIYFGGSSEFAEPFFHNKDQTNLRLNLNIYKNPKFLSAFMLVPLLSKLLYRPVEYISFGANLQTESELVIDDMTVQKGQQLIYEFYQIHLEKIIDIVRSSKKSIVLVTAPINLELPPRKTCDHAKSPTLDDYLFNMKAQIEKGQIKEHYEELKKISKSALTNSESYWMLGQMANQLGRMSEAEEYLQLAHAYDCAPKTANIVTNSIIRHKAKVSGSPLVDFDRLINSHYGKNILFLSEHNPQDLYWNQMISFLTGEIGKILQL